MHRQPLPKPSDQAAATDAAHHWSRVQPAEAGSWGARLAEATTRAPVLPLMRRLPPCSSAQRTRSLSQNGVRSQRVSGYDDHGLATPTAYGGRRRTARRGRQDARTAPLIVGHRGGPGAGGLQAPPNHPNTRVHCQYHRRFNQTFNFTTFFSGPRLAKFMFFLLVFYGFLFRSHYFPSLRASWCRF